MILSLRISYSISSHYANIRNERAKFFEKICTKCCLRRCAEGKKAYHHSRHCYWRTSSSVSVKWESEEAGEVSRVLTPQWAFTERVLGLGLWFNSIGAWVGFLMWFILPSITFATPQAFYIYKWLPLWFWKLPKNFFQMSLL